MADQDAKDINQMMSASNDVNVAQPKKSKFVWVVLACVIVGVGLGVVVYQQSLKPTVSPKPIPKPSAVVSVPSPIPSPVTPEVTLVQAEPKTVAFPKAGEIRVYYAVGGWIPLGLTLKDSLGPHNFTIPAGNPNAQMKIFDTGYKLTGPTTVTVDSFLGTDSSQMSIGWAKPVANKCGFNGFGVVDITPDITYATAQAKGEPIVSVQCWGDYSPSPKDTSSLDFNDYTVIFSYKPPAADLTSPSPTASAKASVSPSPSASVKASPSPSVKASPSPSVKASASPSAVVVASPTPTPSPRVTMPDTSEGTPVTGIFEVTVGTISIGLLLLILGLFGLLAL